MGVPAPAARPARDREAHLEVTPAFDFDPPPGEPSGRIAKEHGVVVRAKNPRYATLAYVPELQTFYAGREDGAIVQWRARMFHDAETVRVSQSRPAFTLRGHVGKVTALLPVAPVPGRFTHGTLATGGADASIRLWDPRQVASSGAQLQHLRDHKGAVLALEQCVDKLVSGCSRGEVRLWAPYDARRPSDDDIRGIADAARRAPIGVTYALFQPLRVLCSFEQSPERSLGITGLSFGRTASVGDHGSLFVATSAGSVFRVRGAKPRGVGEGDGSGSDGSDASDWDDGASGVSVNSFASHTSFGSTKSAREKATGGFSAFMNRRPPPEAAFPPFAEAERFRDFAAEDDACDAVFFEPSELETLGLPFDPISRDGSFHVATRVTHVSYYPSERLVLTLSVDGAARLTDSASGAPRAFFKDVDGARFVDGRVSVRDAAGARVLYLVDDRGCVRLYDIQDLVGVDPLSEPRCARHVTGFVGARADDGDLKRRSRVPAAGIVSVPEAKAVATLSALGRVCGLRITRDTSFEVVRDAFDTKAHDARVSNVAVGRFEKAPSDVKRDDEEDLVFSASPDGALKQRDPHDLMCVRAHDTRRHSDVTAVLVAASAGKLVTGHDDGSLRAWDVVSGNDAVARGGHENAVSCVCEISSGEETKLLLSGGFDGRLVVWRLRAGAKPPERKKTWRAHDGEILAVAPGDATDATDASVASAASPPFFLFASCGNDGMVKLWNGAGDPMCAWRAHGEPVTCLSSLGGRLFTGSEDGTVRVWDAAAAAARATTALSRISGRFASGPETPETRRPLLTLDAYAGPVVGVHATRAMRGGRRHLVTASARAVCVWDVTETHVLQTDLPPPPDGVPISNTEMTNATASSITELDHGTPERTNVSSVSSEQANERRTSRDHREVSRFRRDDDAFTCFAIRERENQILVGTAGGNLLALDVFAPSNDGSDEVRPK
jgi:WD40 repeat protein